MKSEDIDARAASLFVENSREGVSEPTNLDAIFVPAARRARHLRAAVALAKETGAFLVVACSHEASPAEVVNLIGRHGVREAMVFGLPSEWTHPLLDWRCDRIAHAVRGWSQVDVSLKRNVGLLLAHLTRWQSIFFLDDDIGGLVSGDVSRAVELGHRYSLAGFRVREFPDNSVVRHARRLSGLPQEVFISGAALAVNIGRTGGFFPTVYNEDWFYLLPSLQRGPAAVVGTVTQIPYDPFMPARAAREEFGDFVAEALLGLLLDSGSVRAPSSERWWEAQRRRREQLHTNVIGRLDARDPRAARARSAVRAASARLAEIPNRACADWVSAWQADREVWERRLSRLRPPLSPVAAASHLNLAVSEARNE